jgi:BASS family bile acid:Na+ symporter
MNNNGCSLVFATTAFPDQPRVVLPIIFYILVQHVAAATADRIISRRR